VSLLSVWQLDISASQSDLDAALFVSCLHKIRITISKTPAKLNTIEGMS